MLPTEESGTPGAYTWNSSVNSTTEFIGFSGSAGFYVDCIGFIFRNKLGCSVTVFNAHIGS